jgi:DegV family protein with EDD domain
MADSASRRVAIVTDSTANLPEDYVREHNVAVVPLSVIWDGQTYRDGIDMSPEAFYERLATSRTLPTTSQPSAGAFKEVFEEVGNSASRDIVAVHISESLSGTIPSARAAIEMLPDLNIQIVDSRSASMGLGFCAMAAVRAAEAGASMPEVVAAAQALVPKMNILLTPATLEFLYRGGRIGGAQHLIGTALDIKPILALVQGRVEPLERVRTRRKALERLADLVAQRVGDRPTHLAVLYTATPDDAAEVRDRLKRRIDCVEDYFFIGPPTIGAHTGPGTVGVIFYTD